MTEVIKVEDCGENIGDYGVQIYNAILIPENATNGDMLMAMFPDLSFNALLSKMYASFGQRLLDWWHAPFKAEQEVD